MQAIMQSRVSGAMHSSRFYHQTPARAAAGGATVVSGSAKLRPPLSPPLPRAVAVAIAGPKQQLLSSCSSYGCYSRFGSLAVAESRRKRSSGDSGRGVVVRYAESGVDDSVESSKRAQVARRLERTAGYFKRLGSLGFWGQLVCTVVSAMILAFSVVITGAATSPVTLYLTSAGIVAAFLSVFWSFGYMRLSQRLRSTVDDPTKAPPRAQVVRNLKNGIIINILGMGSTLLGLQATVGVLVAKALTSSAQPFLQGQSAGYSPVLALDVFVVQASANALVSHFLGIVFSLELLRSITLSQPPPDGVVPKPA